MEVLDGIDGLRRLAPGGVISVGNFDGLHRGHAEILRRARELRDGARDSGGAKLAVVTFEPHPLTVLRPEAAPPRLSSATFKRELIEAAGADVLVVLPPSHEVLDLAAEDFWAILRDVVRPAHMVEGESFNFGKGRRGTVPRLREWAAASPVELHIVPPLAVPLLDMQLVPVSSSLIRWLLSQGRVRDAGICLARTYVLEGTVVEGFRRGRTIGVPTANLACGHQLVPADGVYAGRCTVAGRTYPVALSIGTMPTFEGRNPRQVEAHLMGFDGDLYGQTIRVEIADWVREQRKFNGLDALKAQMARDLAYCAERAGVDAGRAIVSA
jgi:riboflavin kinase / FMN adenylyltransferase